jgi:general bacterial porin, GBP family
MMASTRSSSCRINWIIEYFYLSFENRSGRRPQNITKRRKLAWVVVTMVASSASAEPSVTLYAMVDLNITRTHAGSKSNSVSRTTLNDGTVNGLNGSRWGIRAFEDLGSGAKAFLLLESGLLADTGTIAQGGRTFGRQAFVGISAPNLGELRLGRQYSINDNIMYFNNPFGNSLILNPGLTLTNFAKSIPQWLDTPRIDNLMQYSSPAVKGTQLSFQLAPSEGEKNRFQGAMASYDDKKLALAVGLESNNERATGKMTNRVWSLAGNYNFGSIKLWYGQQRGRQLTVTPGNVGGLNNLTIVGDSVLQVDSTVTQTVGVSAPIGRFLVGVNFISTEFRGKAQASQRLGNFGIGGKYGLSKNVFLYAAASRLTGPLRSYIDEGRVFESGIRTSF